MTYEYLCTACGHAWEAEQSISAEPLKTCPSCQQETAKRQVSGGAGFILKGGGWYADLYSSAKPEKKSESSSSTKTETKSSDSSSSSTTATSSSSSSSSSSNSGSSGAGSGNKPSGAAAT